MHNTTSWREKTLQESSISGLNCIYIKMVYITML